MPAQVVDEHTAGAQSQGDYADPRVKFVYIVSLQTQFEVVYVPVYCFVDNSARAQWPDPPRQGSQAGDQDVLRQYDAVMGRLASMDAAVATMDREAKSAQADWHRQLAELGLSFNSQLEECNVRIQDQLKALDVQVDERAGRAVDVKYAEWSKGVCERLSSHQRQLEAFDVKLSDQVEMLSSQCQERVDTAVNAKWTHHTADPGGLASLTRDFQRIQSAVGLCFEKCDELEATVHAATKALDSHRKRGAAALGAAEALTYKRLAALMCSR